MPDVIVVLGCSVEPDGNPSACLLRRATHGAELWKQAPESTLFLTGGVAPGVPSEAEVARQTAKELGVPEERMADERVSTSTWGNAREAADALEGHVTLVTDDFHAWRAQRVFRCHHDDIGASTTGRSLGSTAYGALREVLAIVAYAAQGRLSCNEDP